MANCNRQQLNITCGTDVVLHDRLIFDGETFDPNLSVGIAANLVSSLGKRTALIFNVVDDELLIAIPWVEGRLPGCYGLEVTGTCNGRKWSTYADSLIKYTNATRLGVSEVTVESDSYDITQEVGYRYAEGGNINDVQVNGVSVVRAGKAEIGVPTQVSDLQNDREYQTAQQVQQSIEANLVPNAEVTVDDNVGTPSANVTKSGNTLQFDFKNLKGKPFTFDDLTPEQIVEITGPKGNDGDSAIFDPETGNISSMKQTTGDDALSPMSQKAITEELDKTRVYQFEQVDASDYQISNYYIRHDNGLWRYYSGSACVLVPVIPGDIYKIIGTDIYAAYLSDNTYSDGGTPSFSGDTTDEFTWPTGEYKKIPEDVNYLYILTRMDNTDINYELHHLLTIKEKISETESKMEEGFEKCVSSESNPQADLSIEDENGHAIAVFKDGHIITKNFDSRNFGGKYYGKRLSILGDSISTFGVPNQDNATGTWTWPGNRCRYPQNNLFTNVKYQYWYLLMERLGITLGINESWAGSRVSNTQSTDSGDLGPNRCMSSLTRIGHLGENGTPDIILVYGGTNDAGNGVTIGTFNTENPISYTEEQIAALPVATFADAYRTMLIRLQYYYHTARIVCLFPTFTTSYYTITNLDKYEEIIREACDFFGVEYLDLRTAGITVFNRASYLPDGIHPNSAGMELIYEHLVRNIFN